MVQALANQKLTLAAILLSAFFGVAASAQQDPPSRVARLNYINGNVSMQPAGVDDWAPAVPNRPFTTGDYLYTDRKAVAEFHLDVAALRMGELTSFGFLSLNDQVTQLKLTEGDVYLRIHDFGEGQVFEIDTPNAAINVLRNGVYRIHVDPNSNTTYLVVRDGQAEVTGGGQAFTLDPGNGANLSGTDRLTYDIEPAPGPDALDNWCAARDANEERPQSARYLPPTLPGSEDLDQNGVWTETPDYGPLWYPRTVAVGWAPYHYGHWAWIEPWGWTWIDDASWGFAPFHYGRWVYWHERWGWAPGPIAVVGFHGPVLRPIYSPAMVAWFGGRHWGVSIGIGGGPSLGWVPLGFGEVFTPHYACSPRYFSNVNVYNTRVQKTVNITNVYNTVYVNHTVYNQSFVNVRSPNAVVSMPENAFASGRSVRQAGTTVGPTELARFRPAEATVLAPPVAPTRQAVSPVGGQAVHPSGQAWQRQVIARNTPPTPAASFAARQGYLQQHAGQPHNFEAMHQAVVPQAARQIDAVRQVGAVQPDQIRHLNLVPGNSAPAAPLGNSNVRTDGAPHGLVRPQTQSGQPAIQPQSRQPLPPPVGHVTPANRPPGYNPDTVRAHQTDAGRQPAAHPEERTVQPPAPSAPAASTQPAARPQPAVRPQYEERPQPRSVERSQPEVHQQPHPEARQESHGDGGHSEKSRDDGHHDDKK